MNSTLSHLRTGYRTQMHHRLTVKKREVNSQRNHLLRNELTSTLRQTIAWYRKSSSRRSRQRRSKRTCSANTSSHLSQWLLAWCVNHYRHSFQKWLQKRSSHGSKRVRSVNLISCRFSKVSIASIKLTLTWILLSISGVLSLSKDVRSMIWTALTPICHQLTRSDMEMSRACRIIFWITWP